MEFDHVILVEPAAIVEEAVGGQGLRELYVALTRPTTTLVVVHAPAAAAGSASDRTRPSRSSGARVAERRPCRRGSRVRRPGRTAISSGIFDINRQLGVHRRGRLRDSSATGGRRRWRRGGRREPEEEEARLSLRAVCISSALSGSWPERIAYHEARIAARERGERPGRCERLTLGQGAAAAARTGGSRRAAGTRARAACRAGRGRGTPCRPPAR